MKVKVIVTLKKGVLDPQGKAIQQTLNGMNFDNVSEVRQGKFFEIDFKENDHNNAKGIVAVSYTQMTMPTNREV